MAEASEYAYCNGDRYEGSDEYHGQMKIIESMQRRINSAVANNYIQIYYS